MTSMGRRPSIGRDDKMAVYTVHEPPIQAGAAAPDADRYVFVRDGFYFSAFLFAPLWMLWHRLGLVLLGYFVIAGFGLLVRMAGVSAFALAGIGFLIALLIGLEASTLRRFTLRRRGWKNVGVVSGDDLEAAERRYFASRPAAASGAPPAPPPPATVPSVPRTPQPPDVIGLFPEPGASR